jgi:hypothetical protein
VSKPWRVVAVVRREAAEGLLSDVNRRNGRHPHHDFSVWLHVSTHDLLDADVGARVTGDDLLGEMFDYRVRRVEVF